ncbi:MAG TPA: SIMPL domain-containing protein [Terracidiphilus sp.]|nr:SIMPL domain-containing protein [Terracidiphilus sp.]
MRLIVSSILFLSVLSGVPSSSFAQCNTCPDKRTISVTGIGRVNADADLAIVRVGYKLYGADAKAVYANATETSSAVMNALTRSGIPKSAIESTSQILQHTPQYEYQQYPTNTDEWRNRQFTALQSWIIRVKPDDAAGALNTAINAGANESGWIEWIVQDPGTLQAEASAKAVAGARALAQQIVQKSDVRLGQLISVAQNQTPDSYGGPAFAADRFGMGTGVISGIQNGNQPLAINSRRIECTVSFYAVFAIE